MLDVQVVSSLLYLKGYLSYFEDIGLLTPF